MSALPAPDDMTLKMARTLGQRGFRVVRVYEGDKRPVGLDWPRLATADVDVLTDQFTPGKLNLGIACGPQPNGIDLVVVDVDTKHDGMANWERIVAEHGPFPVTATHTTPSGGLHLFWDSPETFRNGKLAPGVDIRGDGGQVVVPPSWREIDGERLFYRERWKTAGVHRHPVAALPIAIWQMLQRPTPSEIAESIPRHPSQHGIVSNADWLRDHWDWLAVLQAQGHTLVKQVGDTLYMRHPTATAEWSAIVHLAECWMVAFSTNMPDPLREAQVNRDGSISWSPYDWFVVTDHDGDNSAAMAEINRRRGFAVREVAPDGRSQGHPSIDTTALNLPASFWQRRPHLEHILIAAQAASCSPDALLVHALTRTATFVHPCFKLPGVEQGLIGKHQTLDFLGCVIAETSGGKTMAAGVGEMLIPAPDPPSTGDPLIDFEQKVGSGEGIAEFFLVPEVRTDDEGKEYTTNRRVIGKQALFMNVDEGTGFTNQAGRKGATIIATLASAWSGESLGQLNAADETRRLVQGGRVRICAVINMQDTNGYKLFTDDLESVGFTGRLLFASAHDPAAPPPGTEPAWPGPLRWPIRSSAGRNAYFTYDEVIRREIKGMRHGILTKQVQIDRRQSQYLLLRCKVAAILATWDDRLHITDDDWSIATDIVSMSATCLDHLSGTHSVQVEVTAVTQAAFKLTVTSKAQAIHLRQLIPGWQAKVIARLRKGPKPWKELKDIVEAGPRRNDLKAVVAAMVDDGVIVLNGSRYEIGR